MEKEELTQDIIQQIICNVIGYSQLNGNLLHRYNDSFYLNYFDRIKIDQTVRKVPAHQKQLDISEFVRLFLSVIQHKPDETLYLAISLTKLYQKIKEETSNEKGVKFADFTSFLCNKISEGDPDLIIPMKQIPMQKIIPNTSKVRDIDVHPPPILNKTQLQRPKITKDKNKKDKKLSQKKPVSKFIYSPSLRSIITLGRLASSITLYNPKDLSVKHKIIPSTCRLMSKDVAILSVAYCQKQQRIGCIINNIGVTFWEAADLFATEKILGVNRSDYDPKGCGDKIYYLELFMQWVTTDVDTIYFWDIKEEVVTKTIKKQGSTSINDICEVNHLRGLLVSYNLQSEQSSLTQPQKPQKFPSPSPPQQKLLILYQQGKPKSKLLLQNPGSHSLSYNPSTQLIISLGYQSNISIYQIDIKTYDINLITQLQAHSSILTCVANVGQSSMIVSGDDIGYLKLWDLNYMRCLQSVKIAKKLIEVSCCDGMLVYSDSRINTIPIQETSAMVKVIKKNGQNKQEQMYGIYQFFRKEEQTLWIITRKQARQISIHNGRIKNVFVLCNGEQDISAAAQVFNGFLIGTSRGEMSKLGLDGQRKWKLLAHEGQIHSIKVDLQNHLIVTIASDNNLYIWAEKSITEQETPRKKISFSNKDISMVQLCPYANLLLVGSSCDPVLTVWNYDNLKLAYKMQFQTFVTAFKILTNKSCFLVCTVDGSMYTFLYSRKETKLKVTLNWVNNINETLNRCDAAVLSDRSNGCRGDYITQVSDEKRGYINRLTHCQDNNMILGSTPKGMLYSFQPQGLPINTNYRREYQPTPTLKRPMKQSLQHQLLKKQYIGYKIKQLQLQLQLQITQPDSCSQLLTLWYNQIHKDCIYFLDIINLQKKYACTLCVDGYFKLVELQEQDGHVVCSHKISFPLPVKWEIDVQNYCDLKNQIHQAIAVIDNIIKNYSYQLTVKEQNNLNVTSFMEKMISGYYEVKKPVKCANVMSEEFSQADVKQIAEKPITLKSLQAYKRLQLIKKQNELPQSHTVQVAYHYQTSATQKQSIRNFLQPNYLPKLLNKHLSDPLQASKRLKTNDYVSRLQDALCQQQYKKQIQKQKQNKLILSLSKPQNKLEQSSCRKNMSMRSQKNQQYVKDKTVKQILSQINSKLYMHKKLKKKGIVADQNFNSFSVYH